MQGLLDLLKPLADLRISQEFVTLVSVVANITTALAFIWIAQEFRLQKKSYEEARTLAIREATWRLFNEWWGDRLSDLRENFYRFVDAHSDELKDLRKKNNMGLGQVKDHFPEHGGKLRDLTYFFDQIGWLGAYGLINVDYILGPMQHAMRRVYWTTDFLIEYERKPPENRPDKTPKDRQDETQEDRWLDPVRHWGLQWLYERSEERPQWMLVESRFPGLSLLSEDELEQLRQYIRDDESKFKAKVGFPG